jgi:hypothetical protein
MLDNLFSARFTKKVIATAIIASTVVSANTILNTQPANAYVNFFFNGVVFYGVFPVNWNEASKLRRGWWDLGYVSRYCAQSNLQYRQNYCGFYGPVNGKPNQTAMVNTSTKNNKG